MYSSNVIPYRTPVGLVPSPSSIRCCSYHAARPKMDVYEIQSLRRGALSAEAKRGKREVWKRTRGSRRDRGIVEGRYVMTNKTAARGEEKELEMHNKRPIRVP